MIKPDIRHRTSSPLYNHGKSMNIARSNQKEFIILMAMLMSMVALTIDAMLPALLQISTSLNAESINDGQLIVGTVFLGMALGQMIYGPMSDAYGRKPAIYLGIIIFLVGDIISITSQDFNIMLLGRVIQGMGAASCRVVTLAMVRDCFEGKEMAKVMSLIMMMFIMVPAIAPAIGQGILLFSGWRSIFIFLLLFGLIAITWLAIRQKETLPESKRIPLSIHNVYSGIKETLGNTTSRNYTFAGGIMFGAFVGYLVSSQQILQIQYGLGKLFPIYFGVLALAIGTASFINSKLVMHFSLEKLCTLALAMICLLSLIFFGLTLLFDGSPSLWFLMPYFIGMFFCFGILFGNFNALAVHPLGHIAGIANSVISTVQTLISVVIGSLIGQCYDGSVQPLTIGFLLCAALTLFIVMRNIKTGKTV
jgi:DHA1 family bicyclomycin/chloramphenicol resistance-like MFS transporter